MAMLAGRCRIALCGGRPPRRSPFCPSGLASKAPASTAGHDEQAGAERGLFPPPPDLFLDQQDEGVPPPPRTSSTSAGSLKVGPPAPPAKSFVKVSTNHKKSRFSFECVNRPLALLDFDLDDRIRGGHVKCRKSKAVKVVDPPAFVTKAIDAMFGGADSDVKESFQQYLAAAVKFRRHLDARKLPLEDRVAFRTRAQIEAEMRLLYQSKIEDSMTRQSLFAELEVETEVQKAVDKIMEHRVRTTAWKPIEYDSTASWTYLLGKAAFDYATMVTVLKEIKGRTSEGVGFQPRTLFDFGSGVGTSTWAAREVFGEMSEVFCVEPSLQMNQMARSLLLKGKHQDPLPAGYFMRVNMPRDHELKYDLVTCSHSLMDLKSEDERLAVVDMLWRKTEGFLVLVENGTNAGFTALQQARHYLLQVIGKAGPKNTSGDGNEEGRGQESGDLMGHLFAPCPQELPCPRYLLDSIPCNFDVRYRNFPVTPYPRQLKEEVISGRFSYLVFKKGPEKVADASWPRVVQEPLRRQGHTICRMCTSRGTLEEIIVVKPSKIPSQKRLWKYINSLNSGHQCRVMLESGAEDTEEFYQKHQPYAKTKADDPK